MDSTGLDRAGPSLRAADRGSPPAPGSIRWASAYRVTGQLPVLVLFATAYILAYQYGRFFSSTAPAPLWFPDSVLLCAFILAPKRRWVLYALICLPIRFWHADAPAWYIASTYVNDCLKAAFSAYLLQRLARGPVRLDNVQQFGVYIGIAGVLGPALSALAGAAIRVVIGDSFWTSWYQWFFGDATAAVVLTPTLLYGCMGAWRELKGRACQFIALIFGLAFALYFTFVLPRSVYHPVLLYAPVPFLILAATKFKPFGVSAAISLLALVSVVSTVEGKGPFVPNYLQHSVLAMQLFLVVISVPMLFVAVLTEERDSVENDLKESRARLKENYERIQHLAGKLLGAQEDERKKIARELHDDIGQRLALLSVALDKFGQELSPGLEKERSIAHELLRDTQNLSRDVHDLSHQLHSSTLQHMGLEVALKGVCRTMARQHQISVEFHPEDIGRLPLEVDVCLFRVAQEALNNAVTHGNAKQIEISLRRQEDLVYMNVRDAGVGFDPAVECDGLGLVSMRERLRVLGGDVVVKSKAGSGTEVTAKVPVRKSA